MPDQNQTDPNNPQPIVPTVDPVVPAVPPTDPAINSPTVSSPTDAPVSFPTDDVPPVPDFMNQSSSDSPVPSVNSPTVQQPTVDTGSAAPADFPSMTSTPKKKFGGGKLIATILGILVLVGGVGTGVYLTQQQQQLNAKADYNTCIARGNTDCSDRPGAPGTTTSNNNEEVTNFNGNKGAWSRANGGKDPTLPENQASFQEFLKNIQSGDTALNPKAPNTCNADQYYCGDGGGFCLNKSENKTCIQAATERGYTVVTGYVKCTADGFVDESAYSSEFLNSAKVTSGQTQQNFNDANALHDIQTSCGNLVTNPNYFGNEMYQCDKSVTTACTSANGKKITSIPACFCGTVQSDITTGHVSIKGNCGCDKTSETNPPSGTLSAVCQNVKAYSSTWVALTSAQLSALEPATVVNFCVVGSATAGVFDRAQFTINGVVQAETTTQRPSTQDYCQNYTIPAGVSTFNVTAKIHHATLGWK